MRDEQLVHWRRPWRQYLYNSMSAIMSEATMQQIQEQIVVSLPKGDPRATDAYNQAKHGKATKGGTTFKNT